MTYDSHRPAAPKVAERRQTLSWGEVRKDENPCHKDGENGKLGKKEKTWENLGKLAKYGKSCLSLQRQS